MCDRIPAPAATFRTMCRAGPDQLANGPLPRGDGWGWLYRAFDRVAPVGGVLRRAVCGWFRPTRLERWRRGLVFRLLGVHWFGAVIPTGGIVIRRVTRSRMTPYTLAGTSLGAARAFYYRACVFEALHMPFFLVLAALAVHRATIGRVDLAIENSVVNLAVNVLPMLHHRHTRARIVRLLDRRPERAGARCSRTA